MASRRYQPVHPDRPARPHLAGQGHHRGAALVRRRPARRQPGPDRPDDARRASCGCSSCSSRWATRRSRSASRRPARPTSTSSAQLIEEDLIPDDVTIQVLTQAREHLIERTFEALAGAPAGDRALLQLDVDPAAPRGVRRSTATASTTSRSTARAAVPRSTPRQCPDTEVCFEYSPGVLHRHRAGVRRRGLQRGHRRLAADAGPPGDHQPAGDRRDGHARTSTPTRSSGCTATWPAATRSSCRCTRTTTAAPRVAAAELGYMAGADRIEGCLFGNGERTGNVCLVTLGMNLFSQGIDPQIDFSDIDEIRRTVEYCNQLPVPRAPPLRRRPGLHRVLRHRTRTRSTRASTRWSATPTRPGADVDDIRWEVPYLPIDPKDVGRTYEAVIRVNSQSGKGGVAYIMKTEHGLDLPRRLQIEFSRVVQQNTDAEGGEVDARARCGTIFADEYLPDPAAPWGRFALRRRHAGRRRSTATTSVDVVLSDDGERRRARRARQRPDRRVLRRAVAARHRRPGARLRRARDVAPAATPRPPSYVECAVDGKRAVGRRHRPVDHHRVAQGRSSAPSTAPCARRERSTSRHPQLPGRGRTGDGLRRSMRRGVVYRSAQLFGLADRRGARTGRSRGHGRVRPADAGTRSHTGPTPCRTP